MDVVVSLGLGVFVCVTVAGLFCSELVEVADVSFGFVFIGVAVGVWGGGLCSFVFKKNTKDSTKNRKITQVNFMVFFIFSDPINSINHKLDYL